MVTGDDETATEPGIYLARVKKEEYYSWKYRDPHELLHNFSIIKREKRFPKEKCLRRNGKSD